MNLERIRNKTRIVRFLVLSLFCYNRNRLFSKKDIMEESKNWSTKWSTSDVSWNPPDRKPVLRFFRVEDTMIRSPIHRNRRLQYFSDADHGYCFFFFFRWECQCHAWNGSCGPINIERSVMSVRSLVNRLWRDRSRASLPSLSELKMKRVHIPIFSWPLRQPSGAPFFSIMFWRNFYDAIGRVLRLSLPLLFLLSLRNTFAFLLRRTFAAAFVFGFWPISGRAIVVFLQYRSHIAGCHTRFVPGSRYDQYRRDLIDTTSILGWAKLFETLPHYSCTWCQYNSRPRPYMK